MRLFRCATIMLWVTWLMPVLATSAKAQDTGLGYSGPQNLANYLNSQLLKAQNEAQSGALNLAALKKRADHGDAQAELTLGESYYLGANGAIQDLTQAAAYFHKAAQQGNAEAQFYFGIMNLNGQGVPQDAAQGAAWYRKAAEQGNVEAQYSLASLYVAGQGVPADDAQAVVWYRKAAEQGLVFAEYNLGLFYDLGRGVPQDYAQAAAWYRKAAEQKLAFAEYNLGLLYANGHGVTKDAAQAAGWYRKAAEQGDAAAQYDLGIAYANGAGVAQNDANAYFWISVALQGKLEAGEQAQMEQAKNVAASYLTVAQRKEVEGRVQKWVQAHSN